MFIIVGCAECETTEHTRVCEESRALHGPVAGRISLLSWDEPFTGSITENTNECSECYFTALAAQQSLLNIVKHC